ncbi:MAG TPA: hypothetical protein VF721_00330 [Pyrinomonadaceae bacterium]|jgi:hypothetical protein
MSNLSDIGFPVRGEQDVNDVIMKVLENVREIPCPRGSYYKFADASGAAIYLQANASQELIGFNPHFEGKSRRAVSLTEAIEKESSELDGAFHAWANPQNENYETGDYPFVFDVPDFRTHNNLNFPQNCEVQLTAFASSEFGIFKSEQDYDESQESEIKFAAKSFVPSGLFNLDADKSQPPLAFGVFTGEIKEFELKTNQLTGEKFYWFLVETLGGEIDVVADPKLVTVEPNIGGYLHGQFWLSGRLINEAEARA